MTNRELAEEAALHCPMCGKQPRVIDLGGWEVLCDCGLSLCLGDDPSRDGVVAAWNTRAIAAAEAPVEKEKL